MKPGDYVKTYSGCKGRKVHTVHKIIEYRYGERVSTLCEYYNNSLLFTTVENPAPADLCKKCEAIKERSNP